MSKFADAFKGVASPSGWAQFPKDVYNNWFGKWAEGTTLEYKNQYRARVIVVCVGLSLVAMPWSLAALGVAAWKAKIIATDQ